MPRFDVHMIDTNARAGKNSRSFDFLQSSMTARKRVDMRSRIRSEQASLTACVRRTDPPSQKIEKRWEWYRW